MIDWLIDSGGLLQKNLLFFKSLINIFTLYLCRNCIKMQSCVHSCVYLNLEPFTPFLGPDTLHILIY